MLCAWSSLLKAWLLNWRPWSVLKTSGVPCREIAWSTALMQKEPWCWTTASRESCDYTNPLQRSGRQSLWPWDVGDIHGPDLIGTINLQPCQQIRVDFVAGMFLAAIGFLVDSFDPHLFHQGGDMLSANPLSIQSEKISQHPCPDKGELGSSLSIFFIRRRARSETDRDWQ